MIYENFAPVTISQEEGIKKFIAPVLEFCNWAGFVVTSTKSCTKNGYSAYIKVPVYAKEGVAERLFFSFMAYMEAKSVFFNGEKYIPVYVTVRSSDHLASVDFEPDGYRVSFESFKNLAKLGKILPFSKDKSMQEIFEDSDKILNISENIKQIEIRKKAEYERKRTYINMAKNFRKEFESLCDKYNLPKKLIQSSGSFFVKINQNNVTKEYCLFGDEANTSLSEIEEIIKNGGEMLDKGEYVYMRYPFFLK